MCSRYTNTLGPEEIGRQLTGPLGVKLTDATGTQRYNIAPSESVLAIVAPDGAPRAELLRFGLLPGWAKDNNRLINARLEGLLETGRFAGIAADQPHRALVIADGWIEWQHAEDRKLKPQPIRFTVDHGRAFCFAALSATNSRITNRSLKSCAIITCDPTSNRLAIEVHNRMPVVLADLEHMRAWIDPRLDTQEALSLCRPLQVDRTTVAPVNPAINRPGGEEGPWLLDPCAQVSHVDGPQAGRQPQLF